MKRNTCLYFVTLCILFFVSSCTKEYSYEAAAVSEAKGSLWDSIGNCYLNTVHGTFYNGIAPGADTAYVEVNVNVTTAGNYIIQTDLQNGFMFSDSGYFSTPGMTTIKLKPLGTPLSPLATVFTFSFDSTQCNFTINVQDSTGKGLGGGTTGGLTDSTNLSDTAWQFTEGTNNYNGRIDTAFILDTLGLQYLTLIGSTAATGDSIFAVGILLPGNTITPGTYTTDNLASFYFTDSTGTNFIYTADITTASNAVLTINITSYDSSTGIVYGTIDGTVMDSSGNPVTISNGRFKAKIT